SFITQDPRDRDLLVRNFKALNFDVPVLNYFGSEDSYRAPYQISQQMRELGISSRLDQVFDASFAVKEVLTGQCGLERSYIGSKETDLKADQVLKLGIFDCWTPENHYRWSKSRYGGHVSGSVEVVK
ncbi:structural maintenance of chromosomes protein 5-like, partial [Morus notabilis]